MRRTATILAVELAAVLASACQANAAPLNPQAMTLRLGDMPAGFSVSKRGHVTLAEAADGSSRNAAQYRRWGYQTG